MKTLQTITTAVIISLSSLLSFGRDDINNNSSIEIKVVEITKPTCNGSNNGSITIEAKGGEAPYTYNWNTFPNQSTPVAINLTSGIYFIQVTDANGEVSFRSVEIKDPNESSLSHVREDMDDLDITASVSGNNAPYTFELNGERITDVDSQDMADLPIGIHQLVITDASNCEMTQYIQIFEIDDSGEKIEEKDPAKEMLVSKNERSMRASNLIPTKTREAHFNTNIVILAK